VSSHVGHETGSPDRIELTVVVLTRRAIDETGPPAVCDDILAAATAGATSTAAGDSGA
jgi:hypothetical protein